MFFSFLSLQIRILITEPDKAAPQYSDLWWVEAGRGARKKETTAIVMH